MAEMEAGSSVAGRYRLQARLDRGGIAQVWEAEDVELGRPVAIKLLELPANADPTLADSFHQEAEVEAALKHPNIAEVYDWGHDGGVIYVVSELLSGRTVRELLDAQGGLPWQSAASIGRQVADALAYAHAAGYGHGALSADRVMVSPDGHATALGFGVACRGNCERPPRPDADTYALGGLIYEMLAGVSPFAPRPAEMPSNAPWPERVHKLAPDTPHELDHIVMRAISPDPDERYQTAAELEAALAALLAPPNRAWLWVAAAVLAVLAASLLTWFVITQQKVVVPDVTGRTTADATEVLSKAGLKLVVSGETASANVPTSTIAAENPAAGQQVRRGSEVAVMVSSGLPKIPVPSVVGVTLSNASQQIANAGLAVGQVKRANSSTYPADTVIDSFPPAGTATALGSKVDLTVSAGQATVTMPDVRGSARADAISKLGDLNLKVDEGEQFSSQPKGTVVSQAPAPGTTVPAGGTVVISVSQGPAPVTIPDLVGSTPSVAKSTLVNLGLVPITSVEASGTDPGHKGIVVGTDPGSGSKVSPGTQVTVTVGN